MKKLINLILVFITFSQLYSQKIIRQEVFSPKMNKKIKVIVVTPNLEAKKAYNSVYILHGFSGNPERIIKEDIPGLAEKSQKYGTIYILPDGNFSSWYVDSPIVKDSQYQTFIGKELVEFIDKNYPVKKEKAQRGILGWSMGGYGATNIGVTYHDTFGVVGSSCGALDFRVFGENYNKYQVDKVLGPFESLKINYLTDSKINQMETAQQHYIFDCGTEDVQMIEQNRKFHQALTQKKIQHLYIESLGAHDTKYWSRSLTNQLALFEKYFGK